MTFIADALKFVRGMAESEIQAKKQFVSYGLPGNEMVIVFPDGTTENYAHDIPDRVAYMEDVDSFCAAVKKYGDLDSTVWVSRHQVKAVLDDDSYRTNRLVFGISRSDQFDALSLLPERYTQRQLVSWLKGYFDPGLPFLAAVRKIDFARQSSGQSTIEHGKESLGRSVEAAVQGVEQIPESLIVEIPVYGNVELGTEPVEIRVDIDPESQNFSLCVAPNVLPQIQATAMRRLAASIEQAVDCPVFIGTPEDPE